jgi:hypothetical protein
VQVSSLFPLLGCGGEGGLTEAVDFDMAATLELCA